MSSTRHKLSRHKLSHIWLTLLLPLTLLLLLSACEAASQPLIPTDQPTITVTFTPSPTRTPGFDATPTERPSQAAQTSLLGGLSPTPLLGATRTPSSSLVLVTPTRGNNPNAPRIEFFTSDPLAIEPGSALTLFWSVRGVASAVIYRLDGEGQRAEVYNVPSDGNLRIQTRSSDRGEVRFVLGVGENALYTEEMLTVELRCPVQWFFVPAPTDCPSGPPSESAIIDQSFERGRMIYLDASETIYVLFNDGQEPAWLSFEDRYDPSIHAERDENAPPEFIQPLRELGYLWRTNDVVRVRLGLGLAEATSFQGFVQRTPATRNADVLYISGADGRVLRLVPGGGLWQIISP